MKPIYITKEDLIEPNPVDICLDFGKYVAAFIDRAVEVYPNKRVIHLAKYGKNHRVRLKNLRRIMDYILNNL